MRYRITDNKQKIRRVNSNKFSFDTVKKYYPDILKGEYMDANTLRFYSPKMTGYIYCTKEYTEI